MKKYINRLIIQDVSDQINFILLYENLKLCI